MADRRKAKPKRNNKRGDDDKLTKQENTVAKYLRFNCPTKTSTVSNEEVHYFTASKAVDTLLDSKWGPKAKKDPLFNNRPSAIDFMQTLMSKGLFWHARKLVPKRKERPAEKDGKDKKERETDHADSPKVHKSPKKSKKDKEKEANASSKDDEDAKPDEKKEDEEKDSKKKKKIKLEVHSEQVFIDGNDVYVWVFDPTPWTKFLIGLGLVLGSILVCLFPLWPPWLRLGIYYLSLVAMGLVGVLLSLAIFRTLLFGMIWGATFGQHHFWLLPNLTEDCGFFESFKPFYSYKHCPKDKKKDKKKDDDAQDDEDGEEKEKSKEQAGNTDSDRDSEAEGQEEDEEGASNKSQHSSNNSISGGPDEPEDSPDVRQRRKGRSRRADDDFELVDGGEN
uniref:Translocation protein SEC62 n=1 Tax=Plectus sambesii TaxID=2011161 RepID=A0A914X0A0_9BILA